jgi:hypothetical protein
MHTLKTKKCNIKLPSLLQHQFHCINRSSPSHINTAMWHDHPDAAIILISYFPTLSPTVTEIIPPKLHQNTAPLHPPYSDEKLHCANYNTDRSTQSHPPQRCKRKLLAWLHCIIHESHQHNICHEINSSTTMLPAFVAIQTLTVISTNL